MIEIETEMHIPYRLTSRTEFVNLTHRADMQDLWISFENKADFEELRNERTWLCAVPLDQPRMCKRCNNSAPIMGVQLSLRCFFYLCPVDKSLELLYCESTFYPMLSKAWHCCYSSHWLSTIKEPAIHSWLRFLAMKEEEEGSDLGKKEQLRKGSKFKPHVVLVTCFCMRSLLPPSFKPLTRELHNPWRRKAQDPLY